MSGILIPEEGRKEGKAPVWDSRHGMLWKGRRDLGGLWKVALALILVCGEREGEGEFMPGHTTENVCTMDISNMPPPSLVPPAPEWVRADMIGEMARKMMMMAMEGSEARSVGRSPATQHRLLWGWWKLMIALSDVVMEKRGEQKSFIKRLILCSSR